jgi:Domain of unknown function (DUF4388)
MSVEGSLDLFRLPEILQLISQQGKTGILTIQGDEDIVAVSFLDGSIVAADSLAHTVEEGLSKVLVSEGLLGAAEFARANAENQLTGGRLLDLLVERRYLTREQLLAGLRLQTVRQLEALLRWQAGDFKFYGGDEVSYEEGFQPIKVEDLLLHTLDQFAGPPAPKAPAGGRPWLHPVPDLPEVPPPPGAPARELPPGAPGQAQPPRRQGAGASATTAAGAPVSVAAPFGSPPGAGAVPTGSSAPAVPRPLERRGATGQPAPPPEAAPLPWPAAVLSPPPPPPSPPLEPAAPAARPQAAGGVPVAPAAPGAATIRPSGGPPAPGPAPAATAAAAGAGAAAAAGPAPWQPLPVLIPPPAEPLPGKFRQMEIVRREGAVPPAHRLAAVALALGLVALLAAAAGRAPETLLLPFPWERGERNAFVRNQRESLYGKIAGAARTAYLRDGRFPDQLGQLRDAGLLSAADLFDPRGEPLLFTAREDGFTLQATESGKPLRDAEDSESVSGNFLLDPALLHSPASAGPPIVLLD